MASVELNSIFIFYPVSDFVWAQLGHKSNDYSCMLTMMAIFA